MPFLTALSLLVFYKEMLFKSLVLIYLPQKGHIAHICENVIQMDACSAT